MSTAPRRIRGRAPALAATLLFALTAVGVAAGPPWISIELPANPYDRSTRGAIALVRTYHHGGPVQLQVRGTAEGLVDGERVSLPLDLVAAGPTGVYAIRADLPGRGTWILVVRGGAEEDGVTAIVDLGPDGAIRAVDVPTRGENPPIPRAITGPEIDARLRSLAAAPSMPGGLVLAKPGHGGSRGVGFTLFAIAAVGLPVGVGVWRARRRG
jgi:hypothetical protein